MEERLRYILSTVNEWLKFAEAKNGALLAVDTAIIFGIFKLASDSAWPHAIFSYLTISLVIASAVSCLVSFIPRIKIPTVTLNQKPNTGVSLLFYAHIAKYDPESYLKDLYGQSDSTTPSSSFEMDFARQIVTNSGIAVKKYHCFTVALWLTVVALILLLIAGIAMITLASA
ncbi:unnamed protein product [marine sediment metagenome]|uniref:Pycsar effector protein domain-containing protein n=1 Tax=marine sediment metagenome TaxID=412755 RepID=X1BP09_9ZZZZ